MTIRMYTIGIDNGSSGSITVLDDLMKVVTMMATPVVSELDYTKKARYYNRIDIIKFLEILSKHSPNLILMEKPLTSPFASANLISHRFFESQLTLLKEHGYGYEIISATDWQKKYLKKGIKGRTELKEASRLIGIQECPDHSEFINKQKDADSYFIAKYGYHLRRGDANVFE